MREAAGGRGWEGEGTPLDSDLAGWGVREPRPPLALGVGVGVAGYVCFKFSWPLHLGGWGGEEWALLTWETVGLSRNER